MQFWRNSCHKLFFVPQNIFFGGNAKMAGLAKNRSTVKIIAEEKISYRDPGDIFLLDKNREKICRRNRPGVSPGKTNITKWKYSPSKQEK